MVFLLIPLCITCLCLGWLYIRLGQDIRSLCGQLEELEQGSHIELAVNSRQKCLLTLCRKLNQVLSHKDRKHIQYEKAEKQLKQNITNLAHDIRTPLTGASGYVQLALESNDDAKRAHYLQAAGNRLTELEDMLEKLFLYTKLTSEDFALPTESMKEIQVLPILGDCLLSLYTQFEKAGTEPEVKLHSEDLCVYAEKEALRRIFLNLIQNALLHGTGELTVFSSDKFRWEAPGSHMPDLIEAPGSHMPDLIEASRSGTHFVSLPDNAEPEKHEQPEKTVCLIFENPVSPDVLLDTTQIFERFYKADTARGKGSSGLGLFIVKELMEKMGGNAIARVRDGCLQVVLLFYK